MEGASFLEKKKKNLTISSSYLEITVDFSILVYSVPGFIFYFDMHAV